MANSKRKLKRMGVLSIFMKALLGTAAGFIAWMIVIVSFGPVFPFSLSVFLVPYGLYQGIRWGRLTEYEDVPENPA